MLGYCRGRNTWSARAMVTGLRSLLRFLHVAGLVPVPLVGAVPSVASWRGASLPRALAAGQVTAMLGSCDLDTVVGRRDHAVLVMLARLGLRTVEVAGLGLDDVDWRSGHLLVRGKGDRVERLPLPVQVGQVLVDYLRDRPGDDCRSLFVRVRAPRVGLTAMAVRQIAPGPAPGRAFRVWVPTVCGTPWPRTCDDGGQYSRADGADGARKHGRCAHLPTPHSGPRSCHR